MRIIKRLSDCEMIYKLVKFSKIFALHLSFSEILMICSLSILKIIKMAQSENITLCFNV